ncbi:ATP-binding protein [Methanocaldococcus sp. 10A]
MKFFDRDKEIKEILSLLELEPNRINFIYGPINCGKTSLIKHIVENKLNKEEYVVFYINLREHFISRYDDFIKVLFDIKEESKLKTFLNAFLKDIPNNLYGIPIPKNILNEYLKGEDTKDIFLYISNLLEEINKNKKRPILVIDELQKIGDLKINGYLIYELFNFFVDLTKEKHLCHVLCLSSDSLFIEKIYNEAMLEGRCRYILIDDFDKDIALKFIDFLAEDILNGKQLSDDDKELIYSYVGGKIVDIILVIEELRIKELKTILEELLTEKINKLMYLLYDVKEEDEEFYNKITEALKLFKNNYEVKYNQIPKRVIEFLVKKNILFLNPQKGTLKPQSYLIWNAIKRL